MTRRTAFLSLAAALVLQALLFQQFCIREILPVFPRAFDQTTHLSFAYDLHEAIRDQGLWAGLATARHIDRAEGIALDVEGALAQFLFGPGRLAALDVNFIHLALLQIALVAVSCWMGRAALGLALCGLLVSALSIYQAAGGIADFRLDFAAFCLVGMLACVAIRSAAFRLRGWTLLFGLAVAVLVLTRTIYVAYLAPGFVLLAALLIVMIFRSRNAVDARQRLWHLCAAGVIPILLVLPWLVMRWETIKDYYLVAHRSSDAAVRAREFGITSWPEHLTFYARSALFDHAGPAFLVLACGILLALAWPAFAAIPPRDSADRSEPGSPDPAHKTVSRRDAWMGLAWLAATTLAAYVVLTSDISKSPVVGGVFIAITIPAVLLTAVLLDAPRRHAAWRVWVLLFAFAAGQVVYASHMVRRGSLPGDGRDMREYGAVMDTIARLSRDLGLRPMISFDDVSEFTHVGVLKAMAFERLGIRLAPVSTLGAISIGLTAIDEPKDDALLARSDFALLGVDRDPQGPELYPVNAMLRKLAPRWYAKASHDMVRVRDASFFGRHLTLFMKAAVHCSGESGGWITSAGMECRTSGAVLASRPIIRMTGIGNFFWLQQRPSITATVAWYDRAVARVPCRLAAAPTIQATQPYTIECELRDLDVPPGDPLTVSLSFDRDFVPKQLGLNDDTRRLVLFWPTAIDVLP